jgi:ATP synthase protein I
MLAKYATIVRRAGALTAIAAAIMVAVSAALVGVKGLIGALIGAGIVAVFFGISIIVVGRAARVSPQAMMIAALASYLVKIVALAVVVSRLDGTTAFSTKTLGVVAIGCILVWTGTQAATAMRVKMLYVEPEQSVPQQPLPEQSVPEQSVPQPPVPEQSVRRGE